MDSFSAFGFRCSRLVVGTAQLGMAYGVANTTGKPSYSHARAIVRAAAEAGVTVLDTAAAYGDSEEVIGRILSESAALKQSILVVTKLSPLPGAEGMDEPELVSRARASIESSLEKLGLHELPLVLFHRAEHLTIHDGLLVRLLEEYRAEGKIGALGVSVSTPAEADLAMTYPSITALQFPVNAVDHRFVTSGVLGRARSRGITVFGRSVYLQGLLSRGLERRVPEHLSGLRPAVARFGELARRHGLSPCELAMAFARAQEGVDAVVVGVERLEQLEENLRIFSLPLPEPAIVEHVRVEIGSIPLGENLVNPACWPRPGE
jgi:aryl-alcohol dehydrogenase-like predicted oxidoreductase